MNIFRVAHMYRLFKYLLLPALLLPLQGFTATLKIATLAPDGTSWMKTMRQGAEEVEQGTKGRVKIRFYPGGVMGNDKSVLRKIRVGQLHGGALTGGGLTSIYPDSQIYSLPLIFRSYQEVDYVRQQMDPTIIDGLKKEGYVSFGLSEGGFAYFMSQQPLSRVEELRKQKVWTPEGDEISSLAFSALGVSPIPLPLTDVLTGLQTGLIDTVATSPVGAIALQWHTRIKHLNETPLLYLYGTLVIKKSAFNRLSKGDRQVVQAVMEKAFRTINEQTRLDNEGAAKALRNQGIGFIHPNKEDLEQWRSTVRKAVDKMGEDGVVSPAMLKRIRSHLAEIRKENG
jgi:TRAP-type C4-dicarboxylate transport system substrate-binding protein